MYAAKSVYTATKNNAEIKAEDRSVFSSVQPATQYSMLSGLYSALS